MKQRKLPQCPTFNEEQKASLLLLQKYLHHKDLKVIADSTTEQRIKAYNEKCFPPLTSAQENDLRKASQSISGWLWQNKASLYNIVYKVAKKNSQLLNHNYYGEDELFNILFLEGSRILYNYDFDNAKGAQPLTYLLHTLNVRKNVLIALPTPYSDDVGVYM